MNGSDEKDALGLKQCLRERVVDAYNASKAEAKGGEPAVRYDFLKLLKCWLDDSDGQTRKKNNENGCPDQDILTFLTELRSKKIKMRDAHLEASEFSEAHVELQEIHIIDEFLPQKLEVNQLQGEIADIVTKLGAKKLKDLPACMEELESRFPGQIDPKLAGKAVREALG